MFTSGLKGLMKTDIIFLCKRRNSSIRLKRWKLRNHVYSQVNSLDTVQKLSRSLLRNILYNKDGLVMINKPYGLGVHLPPKSSSTDPQAFHHSLNTAPTGNPDLSLSEVQPYLAEALGYPSLTIVKSPERYTTGVTILSADDKVTALVQRCIRQTKGQQHTWGTYSIVVLGTPQPLSASLKLGLSLQTHPMGHDKQPMLLSKWSKGSEERREVLPTIVKHSTICQGPLASLVEVHTSRTKWHLLRVYLAHSLSPVLGDNIYGSRVQNVLGVPLTISPFSERTKLPQRLDKKLLNILALKERDEIIIPSHIHLRSLTLLNYGGKGNSLTVDAPFPEFFQWTCKQLLLQETGAIQASQIV